MSRVLKVCLCLFSGKTSEIVLEINTSLVLCGGKDVVAT